MHPPGDLCVNLGVADTRLVPTKSVAVHPLAEFLEVQRHPDPLGCGGQAADFRIHAAILGSSTGIPADVLGQLGNRIQHALRAFTPEDQTALRKTVKTYPNTKNYDMEEALTSLGTGEAIVTVLSETGAPTPVAWARMRAPRSLMAAIGGDAVTAAATASALYGRYGTTVDRESAYEKLTAKIAVAPPPPADAPPPPPPPQERQGPGMVAEVLGSPMVRSFLRSAGTALGREITRGLFGTRRR